RRRQTVNDCIGYSRLASWSCLDVFPRLALSPRSARVAHWIDYCQTSPVHRYGSRVVGPLLRRQRSYNSVGCHQFNISGKHVWCARLVLSPSSPLLVKPEHHFGQFFVLVDRLLRAGIPWDSTPRGSFLTNLWRKGKRT